MTLGDDAPGGEGNSIGIFEFQKGSTEDLDCAGVSTFFHCSC